jgi:hypothetical protein
MSLKPYLICLQNHIYMLYDYRSAISTTAVVQMIGVAGEEEEGEVAVGGQQGGIRAEDDDESEVNDNKYVVLVCVF